MKKKTVKKKVNKKAKVSKSGKKATETEKKAVKAGKKTAKKTKRAKGTSNSNQIPVEVISHRGFDKESNRFNFSVNRMEQNEKEFWTLSVPSDVLAETCFVTSRYDDPEEGFQRNLNEKKAKQIANYIDNGFGTIPTSIILSAQNEAEIEVKSRKTISFKNSNKAFLIIDGQHRVWAYKLAKKTIRVPVVIYSGLTKQEEAQVFIDVNSKQTPVPSDLLLDIKKMAESEDKTEKFLGNIFDVFHDSKASYLKGRMAKAGGTKTKLNRVNFNRALKPVLKTVRLDNKPVEEIFSIINNYIKAFCSLEYLSLDNHIVKSNVFYCIMFVFPEVLKKLQYQFGNDYSFSNFQDILQEYYGDLSETKLKSNIKFTPKLKELLSKQLDEKIEL